MRGDRVHVQALRAARAGWPRRFNWSLFCLCLICAASVTCVAQDDRSASKASGSAAAQTDQSPAVDSKAVRAAKSTSQVKAASADTDRKKQIADESTQLLSMALALKAEVDKTTKDTLSMNVIRKADEIEKLAKTVKEKMKQSGGGS